MPLEPFSRRTSSAYAKEIVTFVEGLAPDEVDKIAEQLLWDQDVEPAVIDYLGDQVEYRFGRPVSGFTVVSTPTALVISAETTEDDPSVTDIIIDDDHRPFPEPTIKLLGALSFSRNRRLVQESP